MQDLAWLRSWGPVGAAAADYLDHCVVERRLVERSYTLYLGVLRDFARASGGASLDVALSGERTDAFLGAYPPTATARRQLARSVLGRLGRFARGEPLRGRHVRQERATLTAAAARARLEQLDAVDAEARYVLARTTSRVAASVATPRERLRAALVACCRHAGATAADLTSMTLDDVAPGWTWAGSLGTTWRAVRAAKGRTGGEKRQEFAVQIGAPAAGALTRWLAIRLAAVSDGSALLFVDPESHDRPLSRQRVWAVVAGIGEPATGTRHLAEFPSYRPPKPGSTERAAHQEHERSSLPIVPVQRIEVTPRELRHALARELTAAAVTMPELVAAMRDRMGVAGRGLGPSYRRLFDAAGRRP